MMDKISLVAFATFLIVHVLIIVSIATPDWIVSDIGGSIRLGLLWSCQTTRGRPEVCFVPRLCAEWLVALVCLLCSCLCVSSTLLTLVLGHWSSQFQLAARWLGFAAVIFLCLAAVILPAGFHMAEIGAWPYQLPPSYTVGVSYILFIVSIFVTGIAELCASRLCLSHR
ncbi:LOW QUALITY PROTEIN: uncharacterized protein C16orf52 homolog A-like [Pollicipes pollicipes]|uniref:LOW QUALITY PROTEIN: uncharacterized protein C16orf52 homolog A-like n=1 Tax=Pollicipes pollicipes TaxID=41117 RepID=UPI001884CBBF|nr:LOW QUALITY PROTEIN: uncharacterized protein C16orf52 homolog A-like [Pollicipes pollicipes]